MKICSSCKINKEYVEFHKHKCRSDGYASMCKRCRKSVSKEFYTNNKEHIKKRTNSYYHSNRSERLAKSLKYQKRKVKQDPFYRISRRLRNRLYYALKKTTWKKDTHFSEYIGCDKEALLKHIESQFQEGMTWDNMGKWHIDHIVPLISAQTEQELYTLSHYTNLQPLWAKENLSKGSKIIQS